VVCTIFVGTILYEFRAGRFRSTLELTHDFFSRVPPSPPFLSPSLPLFSLFFFSLFLFSLSPSFFPPPPFPSSPLFCPFPVFLFFFFPLLSSFFPFPYSFPPLLSSLFSFPSLPLPFFSLPSPSFSPPPPTFSPLSPLLSPFTPPFLFSFPFFFFPPSFFQEPPDRRGIPGLFVVTSGSRWSRTVDICGRAAIFRWWFGQASSKACDQPFRNRNCGRRHRCRELPSRGI